MSGETIPLSDLKENVFTDADKAIVFQIGENEVLRVEPEACFVYGLPVDVKNPAHRLEVYAALKKWIVTTNEVMSRGKATFSGTKSLQELGCLLMPGHVIRPGDYYEEPIGSNKWYQLNSESACFGENWNPTDHLPMRRGPS